MLELKRLNHLRIVEHTNATVTQIKKRSVGLSHNHLEGISIIKFAQHCCYSDRQSKEYLDINILFTVQ